MRNFIILLLTQLLFACAHSDDKLTNSEPPAKNDLYLNISYADGDNANRIKQPVTLSAVLPYNLRWQVSKNNECGSVSRSRGDAYIFTPIAQKTQNCVVELTGTVVNSYGEDVDTINQAFVVQQWIPDNANASDFSGSWGIRFAIPGGVDLTRSKANWTEGAQELADSLDSYGHVMLNLTANAKGFRYLLRDNLYIDIAKDIHPDLVPSADKAQTLFDVIDIFKAKNKKVILYIAADGPAAYMLQRHGRSNPELEGAWQSYYKRVYGGDEGAAWRTLVKGYVEQLKGKVDGYWIDHVDHMPGDIGKFIEMLKTTDPKVSVALNRGKSYIKGNDGKYIEVAADKNGALDKPHRVVSLTPLEAYSDFTSGHPTPLAYGAKPNSWAYEEFTFEEVAKSPWVFYQDKAVLRHWFGPMRTNWNHGELLFDVEQAYRFVRKLTDAGGSITWSSTMNHGRMTKGDFDVLLEVDKRMSASKLPPIIPYVRPKGAKLAN